MTTDAMLLWIIPALILKWTGLVLGVLALVGLLNLLICLRTAGEEIDEEMEADDQ